ncbi:V-type ATP synthase subunit D [Streptomyces sp. MUM 203J]|uniref:V-type ATP synthase subunit D n=1 Tax=Streptomyces sp. MUM 203J TaxID=2791990 RepID=UPI001F04DEB9|nr:V-type ATP synthase subunit D [Streptomyces sp. MUM 203J]MCH0539682.1 V-type ATP synthase subunit D [Streptomyces sp. MUM 203J]
MSPAHTPPPGRIGRLRLEHRLAVARRGADLLERKLRILRARHERLVEEADSAEAQWRERSREAESWLLRAVFVGGEHPLLAVGAGIAPAELALPWTSTLGVRHPDRTVRVGFPRPQAEVFRPSAALVRAEAAYRAALRAAAAYAAARTAARLVGDEVRATRGRIRALRRHWIPRLERELSVALAGLEQAAHEEAVQRRWAARATGVRPGNGGHH